MPHKTLPQPAPNESPVCPYCHQNASLVTGQQTYPHRRDLHGKYFWSCKPCDAFVGCHAEGTFIFVDGQRITSDGSLPKGSLAQQPLRDLRKKLHAVFDSFWFADANRSSARIQAYAWLSQSMGIPVNDCHIGYFSIEQCERALALCERRASSKLSMDAELRLLAFAKRHGPK